MSLPRLLCPLEPDLLAGLHDRTLVIRVDDPDLVTTAAAAAAASGNRLLAVEVEVDVPLAETDLREEWIGLPLAINVPAAGRFRNVRPKLDLLRRLNVRIGLPASSPANLAALRVLASVGVPGCARFADGDVDWDALADLMTYAVLGPRPHAPIEPFCHIAENHDPARHVRWGVVWFDDPTSYLHLDSRGRVALSRTELEAGSFIAPDIRAMADPADIPAFRQRRNDWRNLMEEFHPCSRCPGWRLCLGRFADTEPPRTGCAGFFGEMMEVAEQFQAARQEAERLWRP